ncbi:MAG: heterodisulfide reductase-related iron-sulfur binding cluster, partial [Chloroflexi bacterium]|nr:heterodisulfide reductase-related iron-sulfur binding cluster [Chloroflexota bacterium]
MATQVDTTQPLAEAVKERCGENAYLCYFCRKCTSGCPLSAHMDLTPSEVMRSLQLGFDDLVLKSKTIWMCAHCETCFTRCPQEIDIPTMMDVLTTISRERDIRPALPEVALINHLAISWIRRMGRMYELGIMAERNLRSGQPFRDLRLGMKMLSAGKLKLLPSFVRYRAPSGPIYREERLDRAAADSIRAGYFPGCSQHSSAIEYDMSIRVAADAVGLDLAEVKDWPCCGSGMGHAMPPVEAAAWPMKTLALAAAQGETRVTMGCAACYSRFRRSIHAVEQDAKLRAAVEKATGYTLNKGIEVDHLLDTFVDEIGLDAVGRRVTRPLAGLRVVSYYGCLLTRPPEVTGADHAENPQKMDRLLRRLGAEVLDWSYKTECCGASLMLTEPGAALPLAERLLREAQAVGAQAIAVACPFCHGNLDQHQEEMAGRLGRRYDMPIFYFTQLMGL